MASEESGGPTGNDPVESFIDDLIHDILSEAGQSAKARVRGGGEPVAALLETAIASASQPKVSAIERLLLSQALASALADALAPALAELLAPEIVKALGHHASDSAEKHEAAPATGSARGRKKTM